MATAFDYLDYEQQMFLLQQLTLALESLKTATINDHLKKQGKYASIGREYYPDLAHAQRNMQHLVINYLGLLTDSWKAGG